MLSAPWFVRRVFSPRSNLPKYQDLNRLFSMIAIYVLAGLLHGAAKAQTPNAAGTYTKDLITQPVDDAQRTVLGGNIHPLARAELDRGAAPSGLPMRRMLLVLKRSNAQEAALRALLSDQQTKGSARFHQWMTPEQFGKQFGPSDSDIGQVTAWLNSHGFQVAGIANGRTAIEFSGSAGQVQETFKTAIHSYEVKGEQHWANVSDPTIPSALAPVVEGVLTLHNFPRHSNAVIHGEVSRPANATQPAFPYFTFASGQSTFYGVGPTDFATIYDVLPLWNAGIDGTGQTIAIVGETNINVSDVNSFRSLFGLPAKAPQVILNGQDPGIIGDETEALLDVSWSGAVARNATIDLVASASTESSLGVDLSALYIVDNNLAPVMSESYGECESALGSAGNAFYNALWQQAAAEGITVMVSAGDGGSAGCDNFDTASAAGNGLAISGFASTPYNVAVGGTDFDQPATTIANYWNSTNSPNTESSAKSYIPETTWNQSCAAGGLNGCGPAATNVNIVGGSGGQSNCSSIDANNACVGGYVKPSWQTGTGVPQDGVRDVPDLSLFASSGVNGSFYIICEADFNPFFGPMPGFWDQPCNLTSLGFVGLGGTSASAPAFAGMMALVNQKTSGRQGNANIQLYNLAAQSGASCNSSTQTSGGSTSCIFHDVTKGNDSVPCYMGTPNCSTATIGGFGVLVDPKNTNTPAWTTTTGYDMATGLGTVDAFNLVTAWGATTMAPSTTTLTNVAPVILTHGQPVTISATVSAKSGSGTPMGSVALMATPAKQSVSIDSFALTNGEAKGTTSLLPGGTYNVTGHYAGDGNFGASDSAPVLVTVSKENSRTSATFEIYNIDNGTFAAGSTIPYGSISFLRGDVTDAAGTSCAPNPGETGVACPTGTVSFSSGGKAVDAGTYSLNSLGYAEDQMIALSLPAVGSYSLQAQYSGDASYNGSQASLSAGVTQGPTFIYYIEAPGLSAVYTASGQANYMVDSHQTFQVEATTYTDSVLLAPTGSVSITQDGATPQGTVQTTPMNGSYSGGFGSLSFAYLRSELSETIDAAGTYTFTAAYAGDANYLGSQNPFPILVTVQDTTYNISGTVANVTVAAGQTGTTTLNFAGVDNFVETITVACSLPAAMTEATCSAPSASMAGNTTASSILTISTTAPHVIAANAKRATGGYALALACGVFLFAFGGKRRGYLLTMLLVMCAGAFTGALAGCGGGSGSGGGVTDAGTPAGTYTVNVTAMSSNITRTATFTVTVQ